MPPRRSPCCSLTAPRPAPPPQESLENLAGFLQPFLDVTPREVDAALPPLERANAHIQLGRAVLLLAVMRLKLRGEVIDENHPLAREQVCIWAGLAAGGSSSKLASFRQLLLEGSSVLLSSMQ